MDYSSIDMFDHVKMYVDDGMSEKDAIKLVAKERNIAKSIVYKEYHLDNLAKGNICGGIWVVYGDKDFDVYDAYQKALQAYQPYKNDYDVVLGLEGLRNVHTLEDFKKMYFEEIHTNTFCFNRF